MGTITFLKVEEVLITFADLVPWVVPVIIFIVDMEVALLLLYPKLEPWS